MRLNKRNIEGLTPPTKGSTCVWDDLLPGFGVRVLPSGRKTYVVRFRTSRGVERMMTIGRVEELHHEAARELAREAFTKVRQGQDPKSARDALRESPRLEDLRDSFMDRHAKNRKSGTATNYEILWRRHILPRMGNPVVADVTRADVDRVHNAMRETPVNANRALEVLAKAFALAEEWGWRPDGTNPCAKVKAFPEATRERVLDASEVATLWQALDSFDTALPFAPLVKLLLLTGCRTGEWRKAKWSWVDLQVRELRLPDSKTGVKVVSLSEDVVTLLDALPRKSVFVLPGETGGPIEGHQKMWQRLRKSVGLEGVRLHDLRHTLASHAHKQGLSQKAIADLLGHKQMSTAARYIQNVDHRENVKTASAAIIRFAKGA